MTENGSRAALGRVVRRVGGEVVRLAAIQRVVRAQLVGGPAMFAHFSLFAQVTAGRDAGGRQFERTSLAEQPAVMTSALPLLGAEEAQVRLTVLDPRLAPVADDDAAAAAAAVVLDPDRASGRGYYEGLCFKVLARLGDRKERLLISGLGIDRLAVSR